mmetsp:Transcript_23229/g.34875  ORF Transcript_23229/g.34875 Transcript_23229/m.34875 type:complete len:84 (+) Transcript_23229:721-972(+)
MPAWNGEARTPDNIHWDLPRRRVVGPPIREGRYLRKRVASSAGIYARVLAVVVMWTLTVAVIFLHAITVFDRAFDRALEAAGR